MKGFGIYVKNDLLDGKHVKNMGPAVWLYMWYLDKITAINDNEIGKVLGGSPVTYPQVRSELGIPERTYTRWVESLRKAGYINTLRTPYGLVITVNKASKVFTKKSSAKNGVSNLLESDTPEMAYPKRDTPKSAERYAKVADVIKTLVPNGTNTKTIQVVTNVTTAQAPLPNEAQKTTFPDGKPDPRNVQVQQVMDHFEKQIGKMPRTAYQRRAAQTLMQRHGFDRTIGGINAVAACRDEPYAPSITTLAALRDRWIDLENFYKRRENKNKPKGIVKIR